MNIPALEQPAAQSLVTPELLSDIRKNFQLDLKGIHGPAHWARVRHNGMMLHQRMGAGDWQVIELFAFLHDSQRQSDYYDPEHGPRAASYAAKNCGTLFHLRPEQLATLIQACSGHTNKRLTDNITAQICWDADRLDIGRCGIKPNPHYLNTTAAKTEEILHFAIARSMGKPARELRPAMQ